LHDPEVPGQVQVIDVLVGQLLSRLRTQPGGDDHDCDLARHLAYQVGSPTEDGPDISRSEVTPGLDQDAKHVPTANIHAHKGCVGTGVHASLRRF
jgi:hypothetical protein